MPAMRHSPRRTRALLLAAGALGACASPPPAPAPRPAPAPSTRSVPSVDPALGAEDEEESASGAGTLLLYSSIAGHVPYRSITRTGIVYRDAEAERVSRIEEEIRAELERQGAAGPGAEEVPTPPAEPLDPARLDELGGPREAPAAPEVGAELRPGPGARAVTIPPGSWGNAYPLRALQQVVDADADGHPEETRYFDPGSAQLVRLSRDADADGHVETWDSFEAGALTERVLDSDGDGQSDVWTRYAQGRLIERRVDRNGDGSVDSIYRYEGGSLVEERHDTSGRGSIDLVVRYEGGARVRSEQDRNQDGRMDTWVTYQRSDGRELPLRVERDLAGRGRADWIETYELRGERAVLTRREEDSDGDGRIDVTSYFEDGELVRREVAEEDLAPL